MNLKDLKTGKEDKQSKKISELTRMRVIELLETNAEDLDIEKFKMRTVQCKTGMDYLDKIDVAHRIRFSQELRIANMVSENKDEKRKLIENSYTE